MQINAVIIDDEINNVDNLTNLLKVYCPTVDVVATASGVEEGVEAIAKTKPNLVFLDIQMQSETGFDLLAKADKCRRTDWGNRTGGQ